MALLVFAFFVMMVGIFGVLMFAMRPSSEEKALQKRITHIKVAAGLPGADPTGLLLDQADDKAFAWIDKLAGQLKLQEKLKALILQSDTNITVGKLLFFCAASGIACGFALYLYKGGILGLIALLQGCFYPILYLRWKRNRKINAFNAALADSIDMMSRSLRAGHSVVAAIGIVAEQAVEPVKFEFNEVFKKQNYGLPLRDCLMQLLERVPSQDLRVLVTGMLVQKETGGNLAEILDRITFVIRERIRIQGEIRTHTAQGRLTGWILCALPIVMLVLIDWINPGYSDVLFKPGTGRMLLYGGIGLLIAGGMSIRKIINGIEV